MYIVYIDISSVYFQAHFGKAKKQALNYSDKQVKNKKNKICFCKKKKINKKNRKQNKQSILLGLPAE